MPEDRQSDHKLLPFKEGEANESAETVSGRDRTIRLATRKRRQRWLIIILAMLGVAVIAIALWRSRESDSRDSRSRRSSAPSWRRRRESISKWPPNLRSTISITGAPPNWSRSAP